MPKPTTKAQLLGVSQQSFTELQVCIDTLKEHKGLEIPFDFASDPKKTEAHWSRDRNLRDVVIHLHEWHRLVLHWAKANMQGTPTPFFPKPYNWKTYAGLNQDFWQQHQSTPLAEAQVLLDDSHTQMMQLIETYTEQELLEKKHFPWTGSTSLGSYCISSMSSHYLWAIKKLKAHIKHVG